MDTIIPICAELLTSYERQGLDVSGKYVTTVHNLLHLHGYERNPKTLPRGCVGFSLQVVDQAFLLRDANAPKLEPGYYYVYEMVDKKKAALHHGLVFQVSGVHFERMVLRDLYALQRLGAMVDFPCYRSSLPSIQPPPSPDTLSLVERITGLFENMLLFDVNGKKGWEKTGRIVFMDLVRYWIEAKSSIRMALPAFPCKTSNHEKAAASVPDGADFEALTTLLTFCQRVQQKYEPGCQLCIVSDGHVFSDCIGVDDLDVATYSEHLRDMLKVVEQNVPVKHGGITFMDLKELLGVSDFDNFPKKSRVTHPVRTKIDPGTNEFRRLLIELYSPPKVYVRDLIKAVPEHAITALYRGFSRFMFEDLAFHNDFFEQTKSQRKKAAEEVALEMILRNQAYSRLVETVLPLHIRLSIHAHDNAGPKFAVRLVPAQPLDENVSNLERFFEAGHRLQDVTENLHIPTPWHNTIAELHQQGRHQMVICKAKVVETALQTGLCGGYDRYHPRGGRYVLWHRQDSDVQINLQPPDKRIVVNKSCLRLREHDYTDNPYFHRLFQPS